MEPGTFKDNFTSFVDCVEWGVNYFRGRIVMGGYDGDGGGVAEV